MPSKCGVNRGAESRKYRLSRARNCGSSNQFTLLVTLVRAGPMQMSRLAEWLGIDRTTMSRNIAVGTSRGLLRLAPGKDGRERQVALTAKGRQAAEAALPAWRAAQAQAMLG